LAEEGASIKKEFGENVDVSLDGYDHELIARDTEDLDHEAFGEMEDKSDGEDDASEDDHELVQRALEAENGDLGNDIDYSLEGYDHKLVARDQGVDHGSDEVDYSLEGYDHELVARGLADDNEEEDDDIDDGDLETRDAAAQDTGILAGAVPKNILKKLGRMKSHHVQHAKRSDHEDGEDETEDSIEARDAALPAGTLKKLNRLKPHHVQNSKRTAEDLEELKSDHGAENGGDLDAEVDTSLEGYENGLVARDDGEEDDAEDDDEDFETQTEPQGYDHSKLDQENSTEESGDKGKNLVARSVEEGGNEEDKADDNDDVDEDTDVNSWLNVKRWFQ
jgi:hypothetical protein